MVQPPPGLPISFLFFSNFAPPSPVTITTKMLALPAHILARAASTRATYTQESSPNVPAREMPSLTPSIPNDQTLAEKVERDPLCRWQRVTGTDQFREVGLVLMFMILGLLASAAGCFAPYLMFEQHPCLDVDGREQTAVSVAAGAACEPSTLQIQLGLFFTRVWSEVEVLKRNNLFINDGLSGELRLCADPKIDAEGYNIVFSDEVKAMCTRVRNNAKATAALVISNLVLWLFGTMYLNAGLRPLATHQDSSSGRPPAPAWPPGPPRPKQPDPEVTPGDNYYKDLRRAFNISKWLAFLGTLAAFAASVLWLTRDCFNWAAPSLDGFRNLTVADFKTTLLDDMGPGWPLEAITFFLCFACSVRVHMLHKTCKKVLETRVPTLVKPAGYSGSSTRVAPTPVVHAAPGQFRPSDTKRAAPAQLGRGPPPVVHAAPGQLQPSDAKRAAPAQLGRGPPPGLQRKGKDPTWNDFLSGFG